MPGQDVSIFFPTTLGELHNRIKNDGTAPFYSGRFYKRAPEGNEIISLDRIDELKRLNRSETYIDCGSALPFNMLLQKAGHILPPLFVTILKRCYNPALLSCTTPAGLVYSGIIPIPLSLIFNVMEVSYEIRRLKTHRWRSVTSMNHWIYHNQIIKGGIYAPESGDILLRMRIPSNNWGHITLKEIDLGGEWLYLAITVDIERNYISNFRFSYANDRGILHRDRDREAHITGRTLSGSGREVKVLAGDVAARIGRGKDEKIVRAIYKCIRNFLYQKSNIGA